MKILLVDDYRPFAQSLSVMLKPEHDVHIAGSGRAALAALQSEHFDAMLVDLKLPDMNGLDVCQEAIRRTVPLPRGIVLITGGGADPTLTAELDRLGVKFLEKPFTAGQLLSLLGAG